MAERVITVVPLKEAPLVISRRDESLRLLVPQEEVGKRNEKLGGIIKDVLPLALATASSTGSGPNFDFKIEGSDAWLLVSCKLRPGFSWGEPRLKKIVLDLFQENWVGVFECELGEEGHWQVPGHSSLYVSEAEGKRGKGAGTLLLETMDLVLTTYGEVAQEKVVRKLRVGTTKPKDTQMVENWARAHEYRLMEEGHWIKVLYEPKTQK